jgi:integrase
MPAVKHFTPYVFTAEEMRRLLAAADDLRAYTAWPQRSQVMPAIFRLLYGCGLRASEARGLRVRDVDLAEGLLTIRRAKFDKDRLVPLALPLSAYLQEYARHVLALDARDAYFFPAPDRGQLSEGTLYNTFRALLWACRISHGGVGRGPRLHDLRHTFAVHCLERWVREGKDLAVALPALSTYLGHVSLRGTQRYLRLTAALYPDITAAVEARFGSVIPERSTR